jgi:hypothetical protein
MQQVEGNSNKQSFCCMIIRTLLLQLNIEKISKLNFNDIFIVV